MLKNEYITNIINDLHLYELYLFKIVQLRKQKGVINIHSKVLKLDASKNIHKFNNYFLVKKEVNTYQLLRILDKLEYERWYLNDDRVSVINFENKKNIVLKIGEYERFEIEKRFFKMLLLGNCGGTNEEV